MSPTKTNALLPIEDRTGRSNSRDQHQQKHQWQPERQRKQNAGKIEKRFPARHLWFGRHRHSGPDANNVRQRVHGQAAALGHPPDIGKVSCYLYLVELLQTAVTLLFLQDPQNEKEERACELPPFLKKTWSRSRFSSSSLSEFRKAPAKTAGRYWIQACCVLSPLSNKRSDNEDDLSGSTPLEFVQYPARLLLRKLQDKVPLFLRPAACICGNNAKQASTDRIVMNILRLALNDEIVLMMIVFIVCGFSRPTRFLEIRLSAYGSRRMRVRETCPPQRVCMYFRIGHCIGFKAALNPGCPC